jgi:hypothetical protein
VSCSSERFQPQESGAAATSNKNGAIQGPSGVRGDGRRGDPAGPPTSSSRAGTSPEEPSSEEPSGGGSGNVPFEESASGDSAFPLSQLGGDKSGRVRATRTVRPPTSLMALVRRSAQTQCRAYTSGREVRTVIQTASEHHSSPRWRPGLNLPYALLKPAHLEARGGKSQSLYGSDPVRRGNLLW